MRRRRRDCGHICCPIRRNMWHRHTRPRGRCTACRTRARQLRLATRRQDDQT